MGLSCGNPLATASIKEVSLIPTHSCSIINLFQGETVVDLGSGGGIDVFLAADKAGPTGKIIGIDMSSVSHLCESNYIMKLKLKYLGHDFPRA